MKLGTPSILHAQTQLLAIKTVLFFSDLSFLLATMQRHHKAQWYEVLFCHLSGFHTCITSTSIKINCPNRWSQNYYHTLWCHFWTNSKNSHVFSGLFPQLVPWCEAWEAPYQFPLPREGRYWDGDFRCDGADAERPCRGGGEDGYRCRYEISTVICVHICTLYTMCIQYIYIVIVVCVFFPIWLYITSD